MPRLKTIEHQFDAARYAELVEYAEEIISDDLLLARGWSPRDVVFICCGLTASLAIAGRMSIATNIPSTFLVCAFCFGGLLAAGLKLGSLRSPAAATVKYQARPQ